MAKLREQIIHLPAFDNDKVSLRDEREAIEKIILASFGGFTSQECRGAWKDEDGTVYEECMYRYTVALDEDDEVKVQLFKATAQIAADVMRQICIYAVICGEVQFIYGDGADVE